MLMKMADSKFSGEIKVYCESKNGQSAKLSYFPQQVQEQRSADRCVAVRFQSAY